MTKSSKERKQIKIKKGSSNIHFPACCDCSFFILLPRFTAQHRLGRPRLLQSNHSCFLFLLTNTLSLIDLLNYYCIHIDLLLLLFHSFLFLSANPSGLSEKFSITKNGGIRHLSQSFNGYCNNNPTKFTSIFGNSFIDSTPGPSKAEVHVLSTPGGL